MSRVRAVTFDLWDTVLVDDSDEPKRASRGLPSKRDARREMMHAALARHGPIDRMLVDAAYDTVDAAFHRVWHQQQVTWTVRDRLGTLLDGLGRTLPQNELDELVRLHEEMELDIRPDLVPGVHVALEALGGRYRLGVVSDAVFTPGRVLRRILEAEGLFTLFDAFTFSDEVGRSKPHPAMFEAVADLLGLAPREVVHVGDRESNDVDGPHRVGARAVLVTVARDRRTGPSRADAVCTDYARLPSLLQELDRD